MKNQYIPDQNDIIWLDFAKRVVHIEEHILPCQLAPCPSFRPSKDALYVLEINAGYVKKMGLKVGDVVEFRLKNL